MRQILAALLLALGLASPALAAVCTPTPALPDTERRTEYAGIVAQTGPFNVGFQLYGDNTDYSNWLEVWVNGVKLTGVTDYTVTSPSGALSGLCRPISDAQVTFTTAQTGTVEVLGARRPRRASQFSENAGVPARSINQVISDMEAQLRERWDFDARSLRSPPGETLSVLPTAASRASKFLVFNSSGDTALASPTPGLGNVVGPATSIVGDYATWANTSGTLLADGGPARTQLTVGRTYFVNGSTGSDSNSGLTAGAPFLTPQKAANTVCNNIDLAGKSVVIDLSDAGAFTGTYSGGMSVCGYIGYSSAVGQAQVVVQGAAARSSTCVGYPTLTGGIVGVSNGFPWTFKNLQINGQSTADAGTFLAFDGNCFGTTSGPHVSAVNAGSKIEFISSPYTINGPATGGHAQASFLGQIIYQTTASPVTITGTPAMGGQFVTISYGASLLCQDVTFTGALAASTKHYGIDPTASIQCGKTGITADPNAVLPGDTAGTGLGVGLQLLTSTGPGNTPTWNDLNAFITVTAPVTKSGTTTVNLACASCVSVAATGHGNSDYTILSTDRYVYTTAALTAPRTWTLPAANAVAAGSTITVQDAAAGVTSTNTLSVARAGADTIDGSASSFVISNAGGATSFTSDGVSNWGRPAFPAMSQDATITGAGVITVTKTNNVAFGSFATGTNAANLTGTAPASTIPANAIFIGRQTFCASGCTATGGTYTPTAGTNEVNVRCVGGGGGGGSAAATGGATVAAGAGGAGAGYAESRITSSFSGVTVTIGAAGAAGTAGGAGGNGGNTTFGALLTANGGSGGAAGAAAGVGGFISGAAGGTAPTGDIKVAGSGSDAIIYPILTASKSSSGGSSALGGGAPGVATATTLTGATPTGGYGGGGSGAANGPSQSAANGGAGFGGFCSADEYR